MSIFENTVLVDKKVSVVNVILRYLCIALAIFCVLVSIIVYPGILLVPAIIFAVSGIFLKLHHRLNGNIPILKEDLALHVSRQREREKILQRLRWKKLC